MEINKVYEGNCMDLLNTIPDSQVDLIIADPPYNIGKDEWDKIPDYINWLGDVLKECQRVLKDNGSLYLWHNDFKTICKIQIWLEENTRLKFKSLITWEKYQTNKQYYGRTVLMGINNRHKRNYYPMAEYCLFYTFQDDDYKVLQNIRVYLRSEIEKAKGSVNLKEINTILETATNGGGVASSTLSIDKSEPTLITEEHYLKLKDWLGEGYLKKEYSDILNEFEDNRYMFNFVKPDITTTWLFPPEQKKGHITPKSIKSTRLIIETSTKENDLVLIPFGGSGTEVIACKQLKRRWVCSENNTEYVALINKRLKQKNIHHFSDTQNSNGVLVSAETRLISVKRESADSPNSPPIYNKKLEEENFA